MNYWVYRKDGEYQICRGRIRKAGWEFVGLYGSVLKAVQGIKDHEISQSQKNLNASGIPQSTK